MTNEHVLSAILSTPWAMCEPQLSTLAQVIARRVVAGMPEDPEFKAASERESTMRGEVAVLPLFGVIVPRGGAFNSSGSTSAEAFVNQFNMLIGDPTVKAIIIDVDSPGGSVAGVPEAADAVHAARGSKAIVACTNHLNASAAYFISSQAHEVVISPSGSIGSIGVMVIHDAIGKQMELLGVDEQYVTAGKFKAEVNQRDMLEGESLAHVQSRVDAFYDLFVRAVARGRGASASAVRGGYGEGRVLGAQAALAAGLVDRVATLEETVVRLNSQGGRNAATRRRAEQSEGTITALGLPEEMTAGLDTQDLLPKQEDPAVTADEWAANLAAVEGVW